jgi:hypothetical protein
MPSAVNPWRRWKRFTARWVCDPNTPSAGIPRACWSRRTSLLGCEAGAAGAAHSTARRTVIAASPILTRLRRVVDIGKDAYEVS